MILPDNIAVLSAKGEAEVRSCPGIYSIQRGQTGLQCNQRKCKLFIGKRHKI